MPSGFGFLEVLFRTNRRTRRTLAPGDSNASVIWIADSPSGLTRGVGRGGRPRSTIGRPRAGGDESYSPSFPLLIGSRPLAVESGPS